MPALPDLMTKDEIFAALDGDEEEPSSIREVHDMVDLVHRKLSETRVP
jgi:hypothetical protein